MAEFAARLYAKIVDPDQTPRCAAFDLSLHCLSFSFVWKVKHSRDNLILIYSRTSVARTLMTRLQRKFRTRS